MKLAAIFSNVIALDIYTTKQRDILVNVNRDSRKVNAQQRLSKLGGYFMASNVQQ